jgi:predicted nucleic acid-binding protein
MAAMERPKYVLDSSVVINHLNSKLDIDAFFNALPPLPKVDRFISGITAIEALSKPGMTELDIAEAKILLLKFVSIDLLGPKIKETAAVLRRDRGLLTPDAIIAATAIILGATCLSNDDHLLKLVWPGYTVKTIPLSSE